MRIILHLNGEGGLEGIAWLHQPSSLGMESSQRPLGDMRRSVDRRRIRSLDEGVTDDADARLFGFQNIAKTVIWLFSNEADGIEWRVGTDCLEVREWRHVLDPRSGDCAEECDWSWPN